MLLNLNFPLRYHIPVSAIVGGKEEEEKRIHSAFNKVSPKLTKFGCESLTQGSCF